MEKVPTPQSPEQEKELVVANLLKSISEQDVQEILDIDKQIFPSMPVEEEEIRETLESEGVQVVLKDAKSKIVGYIISLPHEDAYEFLSEIDPNIENQVGGIYVESIGILPEHRSLKNFNQLWSTFAAEAQRKGFKKITAHVRVSEGLSAVLQKRFGAVKFRTYDNWADFNEPFDYLEMELGASSTSVPDSNAR